MPARSGVGSPPEGCTCVCNQWHDTQRDERYWTISYSAPACPHHGGAHVWQHEDTGRLCTHRVRPGPRWFEVKDPSPEIVALAAAARSAPPRDDMYDGRMPLEDD